MASNKLILSINEALVHFGGKPLFDGLDLFINEGDKIALVGKNGSGKTTLMHMISGVKELDGGKRWQDIGATIGYLEQDVKFDNQSTVFNYVFSGLPKERQTTDFEYMVALVTDPLELDVTSIMGTLSGGQLKRAHLARVLIAEPDILLLDEPTNHLDLDIRLWLEGFLKNYRGAYLCVSHDKTFLANISDKIFWLDRGRVRVCPRSFSYFDEWSSMLLDQEARELKNREKALSLELEWASRGVKARRKRNIQRLNKMKAERERLMQDRSSWRRATLKIELPEVTDISVSARIVTEFYKVNKSFFDEAGREKKIIDNLSLRVLRGERIGILGKNGSGKTSLIKLLLGQLEPDSGKIKLAKNVEIAYFDQNRSDLRPDDSLMYTLCPKGGEYINVLGKVRHVCGYLKDFMFDPKAVNDLVHTLSGGQKNRLMLAKILANPGNFLILDEPTNDLDMDSMEMLEEMLANYQGTLFIVSHDRDFLDQTVNKIIAFEGDGEVNLYIGGYSEYLAAKQEEAKQIQKPQKINPPVKLLEDKIAENTADSTGNPVALNIKNDSASKAKKLSYKLQYEYETLPAKIAELELAISELNSQLKEPDLYKKEPDDFAQKLALLSQKQQELEAAETKWLEISELI